MVAIQRDDDVAGSRRETALVASSVAAHGLADYFGAERPRHFGCAVPVPVIHPDHLVHEIRHPAQYLFYPLLLIQTGSDYCNPLRLVHVGAESRTEMPQSAAPALVPYSHEVVLCLDRSCGCCFRQRESPASPGEAGLHPGNE